jgi:hypothetical protein
VEQVFGLMRSDRDRSPKRPRRLHPSCDFPRGRCSQRQRPAAYQRDAIRPWVRACSRTSSRDAPSSLR